MSGNFDERLSRVNRLLDDQKFVEHLNTTFIMDSKVDGQRPYKSYEIEMGNESIVEAEKDGFKFEPDNICFKLGNGLAANTENFTKAGSFVLTGETVSEFVDSFLFRAMKDGWRPDEIGVAAEAIVTGAIGIGFGIPFESYQTDITISGQGLLEDTYFMDVQFRPIPKNIEV